VNLSDDHSDCIAKCNDCCVVWKGDGDAEVAEAGYSGDAADMMEDYQQSGDESDLEQDVANDDYVVEEPDDFDVTFPSTLFFLQFITCLFMSCTSHCHAWTCM